ncbi:hypothetical protein FM120_13700 [Sphingobacterium faecium PCAi_F2.5]|nr:hypothetical protein HMPREF9507_00060 [Enterococcus faecalis TX0309B]EGG59369.1 hypothetical protein HMPREF9520_00249 [Enterococcus faecalis TX1467]SJN42318.1 hypothetical protein FM120_13700 [Sphingobacterium faecium PCAi_F2.5]
MPAPIPSLTKVATYIPSVVSREVGLSHLKSFYPRFITWG